MNRECFATISPALGQDQIQEQRPSAGAIELQTTRPATTEKM
jgi:hypothetical protein